MLAIRRLLNSCIQADLDQTDMNESNKENSAVRKKFWFDFTVLPINILKKKYLQMYLKCKNFKSVVFIILGNIIPES